MIEKMKKTEDTIVIKKVFKATAQKVFDAWSKPKLMAQWFSPSEDISNPFIEVDFKEGGEYRIAFQVDEDKISIVKGIYKEIQPNKKIVFTWQWEHPHELAHLNTLVTLNFQESDGTTELTLIHEGITDKPGLEDHDKGWNGCLVRLSKFNWNLAQ